MFAKSVFLLEKKEHVPLFQNPLSQNPLVPLLGEVPFIVLRPIHRDWYWGHLFLSTVLGTLSPKKNVPNTVSVLGTLSLINTVLVLGTLSQFQY